MPRTALIAAGLAAEFETLLRRVAEAAHSAGRDEALAEMRAVFDRSAAPRRGPGRPRGSRNKPKAAAAKPARTRSGKKRKNPWASMTPAQRLARVNAIRKGRGLPVKEKL